MCVYIQHIWQCLYKAVLLRHWIALLFTACCFFSFFVVCSNTCMGCVFFSLHVCVYVSEIETSLVSLTRFLFLDHVINLYCKKYNLLKQRPHLYMCVSVCISNCRPMFVLCSRILWNCVCVEHDRMCVSQMFWAWMKRTF